MWIFAVILIIISISKLMLVFSDSINTAIDKASDNMNLSNGSKERYRRIISFLVGGDGFIGLICGIFILVMVW